MPITISDLHDLIRLLEEHPEWRAELRRVLLTEDLLRLPDLVRELIEAQQRTEQQLAELVQITREHSQMLAQHSQVIAELVEVSRQHTQAIAELREAQLQTQQTVQRIEQTTMWLVDWQKGEAGRRDGREYEYRVVRRAVSLFAGGEGGSPEKFSVHRRLARWLRPVYQGERVPDMTADPFLADIIWWKGDEVMVVEVSIKVDQDDIRRARQRADTLRKVGVNATPAVIGEEWLTPETQAFAQQEGVEWMVGGGLSQGFLRFRRLSAEEPTTEAEES